MDKNLEQYINDVHDYLEKPRDEKSIEVGANLMVKGNRNRTLLQNILRKTWWEKLEYELGKIVERYPRPCNYREAEKQVEMLSELEKTQKPEESVTTGKREDHDQLPVEIQAIIETNVAIYQKIRATHERLKVMSGDGFTPCDRKPFVEQLLELDKTLRENWDLYDNFKIGATTPVKKDTDSKTTEGIDSKRIGANRTYLSRAADKDSLTDKVLAETQSRYDEMILNKIDISAEMTEKLKALGIKVIGVVDEADTSNSNTDSEQNANTDLNNPPAGE